MNTIFSEKDKKAKEYMNTTYGAKYEDEFEVINAEYAGFTSRADSFTMSSKRFPDFYIRVSYFEEKYTTNYMEIHFYKQYQQYMQPIFEKALGECKVLLDFTMSPSVVYTENTTFKEFLLTKRSLKSLTVFLKDDKDLHERVLALVKELKEKDVPVGTMRFMMIEKYEDAKAFVNENDWGKYKRADKSHAIQKKYKYSLNRDYEIRDRKI